MTAVPIQLADLYAGFAAARGLLRDDGDHLTVEYEVIDSVFETFKSGVKQFRIPTAAVADVRFESGWFGGGKIVIQAERLQALEGLHGAANGRVTFTVARADFAAARRFVDRLHTTGDAQKGTTP